MLHTVQCKLDIQCLSYYKKPQKQIEQDLPPSTLYKHELTVALPATRQLPNMCVGNLLRFHNQT